MLTALVSLLLASSPLRAPQADPSSGDDCADTRRLELSPPVLSPPRLCISPGTLTGVIFNQPVEVELQDEVRFVEVIRGREGIVFIPPRDLRPGEFLRLTAALGVGEVRQNVTLVLVAHPGHGSHQVEVNYNERNWQFLHDALNQALLANKRLIEENMALKEEATQMQSQLAQRTGLCGAYAGGQLNELGITSRRLDVVGEAATGALKILRAASYRGVSNVAVWVRLSNHTQEPWHLETATLVNEHEEKVTALRIIQSDALLPGEEAPVLVEFKVKNSNPGRSTLTLTGSDNRTLTLLDVVFPLATLQPGGGE